MISESLKQVIAEAQEYPGIEAQKPMPHNGLMEERIKRLEDGHHEIKKDLVRIDSRLDHIESTMVTRADIAELRVEVLTNTESAKTAVADMRSDLHKMDASIKTWMVGTIIAMMVGFGGLFWNITSRGVPAVAQATPPVIINMPAAAAAPAVQQTAKP